MNGASLSEQGTASKPPEARQAVFLNQKLQAFSFFSTPLEPFSNPITHEVHKRWFC